MNIDELPEMLRVEEAARLLRIGRSTAYGAVAQYQVTGGREGIPSIRIKGTLRVPTRKLLRWIDEQVDGVADELPPDVA
jgi:hypothetical protein